MLERHCHFSLAAERARELGPSGDARMVRYHLGVTAQAVALLAERPRFSIGGARDIRRHVERARLGSSLSPADLLEVLDTVSAARGLRRTFLQIEERAELYPAFAEFVGFVADLPNLEADLKRSIGDHGEVLDSASDALRTIRRQLRTAQSRAAERIRRYLTSADSVTALQELLVTTRDGRYVVPVRADRRTQLPGVVHDTSASGQTLFVEPTEMVELNNRVRELEAAEQHEIDRILAALSAAVAVEADRLEATLDALAAIDLSLAKARFASQARLHEPVIVDHESPHGRRIALRRARHPLLDPATAVPIDLTLGDSFRVLVITGPNTGGKTVALKTVGLLALMTQAGLFIPADEGSQLPVFDGVFADIGDEQSIEQSLSTFSSHTVRVVAALRAISPDSLVLFDELGAGTDPEEGAALARAIIERLLEAGCLAVGTTHYSELKSFAYATPGVENASVEFDVATLSPTYRLLVGVPGRSNALAIAGRLGMPPEILDRARTFLDPNVEHVDTLLNEIHARRAAAEQAEHEAEAARGEAERRLAEAEELRLSAQRQALAEIEQELYDAREAIRQVRRLPERLPAEELRPAVEQARRELEQAAGEVREVARQQQVRVPARERLRLGDRVELTTLGGEGEIVGFSEDGLDADIQMGAFKLRQAARDLRKLEHKPEPVTRRTGVAMPAPRRRVDMELQLRGHRAGGVESLLEQYLDDAYLSNMPFVRIVHGKGTGALREAVQSYLKRSPVVARYETPPHNEGGDGVTVVYLKES